MSPLRPLVGLWHTVKGRPNGFLRRRGPLAKRVPPGGVPGGFAGTGAAPRRRLQTSRRDRSIQCKVREARLFCMQTPVLLLCSPIVLSGDGIKYSFLFQFLVANIVNV